MKSTQALRYRVKTWFQVALLIVLLLAATAHASEIRGTVVAVADGDTVTVLDEQRVQHRVRLQGIDAPEGRQAFGQRSRQYLASMVHNQEVVVRVDKIDRFGRAVGVIYRDGEDVNLRMVQAGLAWHYKQYQREQTTEQRRAYAAAEDAARRDRVGFWSEPNPVAPWDFRRAQRN